MIFAEHFHSIRPRFIVPARHFGLMDIYSLLTMSPGLFALVLASFVSDLHADDC